MMHEGLRAFFSKKKQNPTHFLDDIWATSPRKIAWQSLGLQIGLRFAYLKWVLKTESKKMKRSTAVIEIAKVIEIYGRTAPNFQALEIMALLDKLGMLPPARMRYIETENGNTLCSEDCSWEVEDDAN